MAAVSEAISNGASTSEAKIDNLRSAAANCDFHVKGT